MFWSLPSCSHLSLQLRSNKPALEEASSLEWLLKLSKTNNLMTKYKQLRIERSNNLYRLRKSTNKPSRKKRKKKRKKRKEKLRNSRREKPNRNTKWHKKGKPKCWLRLTRDSFNCQSECTSAYVITKIETHDRNVDLRR